MNKQDKEYFQEIKENLYIALEHSNYDSDWGYKGHVSWLVNKVEELEKEVYDLRHIEFSRNCYKSLYEGMKHERTE